MKKRLDKIKKMLQWSAVKYFILLPTTGADVNGRLSGDSPLHIAARLSSPELVSALLHHGANSLLVNSEGKRPLDLVPPNSRVGRLLTEAGGIQSTVTE